MDKVLRGGGRLGVTVRALALLGCLLAGVAVVWQPGDGGGRATRVSTATSAKARQHGDGGSERDGDGHDGDDGDGGGHHHGGGSGVPLPPITIPPVTIPPITVPPITIPPITVPPINVPPVTVPPVHGYTDAVAMQLNPAHTGAVNDNLAANPKRLWSVDLTRHIGYPLIAGGRVFVVAAGLDPMSGRPAATLYGFDGRTGVPAWAPVDLGDQWHTGMAYDRGRLFVLDDVGNVVAVDALTGVTVWTRQLGAGTTWPAPPTATNGVVYVAGGAGLLALDEGDGHTRWSVPTAGTGVGGPTISATTAYASSGCQINDAYDLEGALLWRTPSNCGGGLGSTSALYGGKLWVRDPEHCMGWVYDASAGTFEGIEFTSCLAAAYDGGFGYYLDQGRGYHVVDRVLSAHSPPSNANAAWTFDGAGLLNMSPIVVNGSVFIADGNGKLYRLRGSDGAVQWSADVAHFSGHNNQDVGEIDTGLAEGDGLLAYPADNLLVVFG